MSLTIPVHFVQQFSANVRMLAEQKMSRLRSTAAIETVNGESVALERLGGIPDVNEVTERHGDTPLNEIEHTRRWLYITDYDVANLIDKPDRIRLLIDPDSKYTIRHASAMGRKQDDVIINALGASVTEGKSASTTTALPSAQKILSGSTGLTIDKLITAKEILDAAEIDDNDRFCVVQSRQISNLLADDKISNADYNAVKALVRGEINQYLGFTFIRLERLQTNSSSERLVYCYTRGAVTLGIGQEIASVAAERPDKRHAQQIYTYGSWGATRLEDEQVVQIACTE
jgi:hypothetical protein